MNLTKYKHILKQFVPSFLMTYAIARREHPEAGMFEFLRKTKLIFGASRRGCGSFVRQTARQFSAVNIDATSFYIYPYDSWIARVVYHSLTMITSVTPDYGKIIETKLAELQNILAKGNDKSFAQREMKMIENIRHLCKRIQEKLVSRNEERGETLRKYFIRMLDNKPETLDEAIQKLLFYNALFWQVGHWQCGLGRLDMILNPYYENDLREGQITREGAKVLIREMCLTLGRDMRAKSRALIGDTGQYILLGGVNENAEMVDNELTKIFLEVFTEINVPDPKLILRVNAKTSDEVWQRAIKCISTGCGSPLFVNENLVMKGMVEFGYKREDVWNFGTSACWEPLIIGKSFDQNNPLLNIPVVDSLSKFIRENSEIVTFDDFLGRYKLKLKEQVLDNIRDVEFDCSPLYSLFFDQCIDRQKDFSQGGADYAYHGVQIVSLPNLVNALLNLKTYVFERKIYTLNDCVEALNANFEQQEQMREVLLSNPLKFGLADKTVIALTNDLMNFIGEVVQTKQMNGQKTKVGFSSSHYIIVSKGIGASIDGRKDSMPFAVHISPVSQKIDLQEVLDFASQLDYSGNKMNGNVVDFILPKVFADQPQKLQVILQNALNSGVYELQLNVLDAATLRYAKAHPEKYPALIVRVWGFSAYFNDLPEEYKDNLIARAEAYA